MSSRRTSSNSQRQNHKTRRDLSPVGKSSKEKSTDSKRNRGEQERFRSETDLSKQEDTDKEKDKDRRHKEKSNVTKTSKSRNRSPRRSKDTYDRKFTSSQKRDTKLKNEPKDKKDKKNVDVAERHPLFQDNSRLAQLIAQVTGVTEDATKRVIAAQNLLEYTYDVSHLEPLKRNCSSIFSALEEILRERGNNELKDKIVKCYASIGHVLGIDCDKFFQWIFSKIPTAPNDQLRVYFLQTIVEAVKLDVTSQVFYDAMVKIMACLQDVLENADSPELLLVLLDVLKIIARDYPHIFAEYFRDTVDILVGWHIDTSQNEALTQKTADCLVSFHPYWVSDMRFSLTLLGQFLEDMEAYAEELDSVIQAKVEREEMGPYTALPKLTALTKVFTTVVSGLGEFFSPGREAKITSGYISDTVERIIKCVDVCGFGLQFDKLLIAANKCLTVLVTSLGTSISVSCLKLVKFVNNQLDIKKNVSYNLLKSSLFLMDKVVATVGASLPVDVIPELLQMEKPLMRYRSIADPEILAIVIRVFQSLLSVKNMSLLEKIYKFVVTDIQFHYSILKQASKKADQDDASSINKDESYTLVVFNTSVLAEIATYKSSISGAWKVEPSTFDLLTRILDPTNKIMAVQFPGVQHSILTTLYTHSQRCNNFVPGPKSKSSGNCKDSNHLIKVLCSILSEQSSSTSAKCLCANWLCEVTNSIASLTMDLQKRQWDLLPIVDTFIKSVHFIDNNVKLEIAECTTKLAQSNLISAMPLGRLLAEFLIQLTDIDEEIQTKFQKVILSFPADILASLPTVTHQIFRSPSVPQFLTNTKDLWLLCKRHMGRTPTGTLHSHGFRIIMSHLLDTTRNKNQDLKWMEALYSTGQRLGKVAEPVAGDLNIVQFLPKSNDSTFPLNGSDNGFLLAFWVCWMAAEYCVFFRLKTPLGKAPDTFQSIEASVKDLEHRFRELPNKKNKKADNSSRTDESSKYQIIHQAVLLLQFLENLDKLMYNSYEGTATSLPPYIRSVRTFFRTNRNTCCEWLNRIQESTTKLANLCGCPEKALRNGFLWLQNLKNTGNTHGTAFENAVVTVVDSLIQLHCYQGVKGILDWARKEAGRDFFWLRAAIPKANGSLENAAVQLKSGLQNYLSPDRLKTENLNEPKKATVTVLTKDPVINADPQSIQFLVGQIQKTKTNKTKVLMRIHLLSLITLSSWIIRTTPEMCTGPPVEHRNVKGADYIIGGMFPVHYKSGGIYKFNSPGLTWITAMMFAIEEINNSTELLPKVRLGYRIFDSCNTIDIAIQETLQLTQGIVPQTLIRNTSTLEKCPCVNLNTSVIGLVGDAASATTTKIASILSATSTPQISYSATSTVLSDKFLYPSFLRTIPPDSFQAILITDFMKQLGWRYINVIACDDDYGRIGVDELLPLLKEYDICLAVNEVYDVKNDLSKAQTREVITKIRDEKDASAIVLWCQRPEALEVLRIAEELQVHHRTWIATETYGNSAQLLNFDRRVVQGLFGIVPAQITYKPLIDRLNEITPNTSFANNPWLHEYWVDHKGCTLIQQTSNNKEKRYLCKDADASLKELPVNKYVNVINSVYSIAHALNDFMARNSGRTPNTASELLDYVRKVEFSGVAGNMISYTGEGNPQEALYSIVNLHYNEQKGELEIVNAGYWNYKSRKVYLNTSLVQYANNKTTAPKSSCTEQCKPGFKGLSFGDKPCCWKCIRCLDNTIQPEPNKDTCIPCPAKKLPNSARTKCLSPSIKYLDPQKPSGGIIIGLMAIGYVLIITVAVTFIQYRNTPVVKASNRGLSFVQVFSMMCQLALPVSFMQAEMTKNMCGGTLFYFVFFHTITVSVTFTKADRMLRVFEASKSGILSKHSAMKGNTVQYATVFILTLIGVALCLSMYLVLKIQLTRQIQYKHNEIDMVYYCDGHYDTILFVMVSYIFVIALVCTVYAFKARKLPHDFNDVRYTSYAMFLFLLTWIMAVPIYFSQADKINKSTSWCILTFLSTISILIPMYLPKCYLILFKPKQNTEARFRENLKRTKMKKDSTEPSTSSSMTAMTVSNGNGTNTQIQNNRKSFSNDLQK